VFLELLALKKQEVLLKKFFTSFGGIKKVARHLIKQATIKYPSDILFNLRIFNYMRGFSSIPEALL